MKVVVCGRNVFEFERLRQTGRKLLQPCSHRCQGVNIGGARTEACLIDGGVKGAAVKRAVSSCRNDHKNLGHAVLLKLDDHLAGVAALEQLEECGRHVVDALAHRGLERD